MDRKTIKKDYRRSRSRSEKRKKRERKSKTSKKRKDNKRRHSSSSRSSSSSSGSNSRSPQPQHSQVKMIPIAAIPPARLAQSASNLDPSVPSSVQSVLNRTTNGGAAPAPVREKRNVFSSPTKQTGSAASIIPGQLGFDPLQSAAMPLMTTNANTMIPNVSNMYDMNITSIIGNLDSQIIGNKIPPHLQKNYGESLRVYIGNIPDPCDVADICDFVYQQLLIAGGLLEPSNPIQNMRHDPVKKYIFLNLRSIEETTACLELDGVLYKGKSLRFRRPQNYGAVQKVEGTRPVPHLDLSKLKIVQTQVENTYNKLQIMNLPETFSEEHVMQLLANYGSLKSFHLAVDKMTSESKGFAFCEFWTDRSTFECLQKLNGQTINAKVVAVKRCNANLAPPNEEPIYSLEQLQQRLIESVNKAVIDSGNKEIQEEYVQKMIKNNAPKYEGLVSSEASTVLRISNVVDKQIIEEDSEYELVFNDLKQQLERIGKVKSIIMPRKKDKYREGIGYAYVEFENEKVAQIASYLISKLKYDGREVKTEFYRPQYFADKTFF